MAFAKDITIRIHCWKGYARPYVDNFVKLIKEKYKIDIHLKITNVSDPNEFWQLSRGRMVDLISPAHNIPLSPSWAFVKGKVALPVNLNNIPRYKNLLPILNKNDFVTQNNKIYAVPYTMGPYGLGYNAKKVEAPESWNVLWEKGSEGYYSISKDYSDCNIYISSLVLGASYEDLYNVDRLFKKVPKKDIQKKLNILAKNAGSLWQGTANPDEFDHLKYAATWGYAVAKANANGLKWKMAKPREGSTMWVDHWLITYAAKDPLKKKLCEEWINYCLGPEIQVGVIRNWGVSPVVTSINHLITKSEIETFNVADNDYWKTLSLWEFQKKRTKNAYGIFWHNAINYR
jgi:spermidine/putrescine transport system substrate-binding protein